MSTAVCGYKYFKEFCRFLFLPFNLAATDNEVWYWNMSYLAEYMGYLQQMWYCQIISDRPWFVNMHDSVQGYCPISVNSVRYLDLHFVYSLDWHNLLFPKSYFILYSIKNSWLLNITYTCTHQITQSNMHGYTSTDTHTHSVTCIQAHTHTHTHTHAYRHTHTCTHTCTHTHTHTHIHTHTHAHIHAYIQNTVEASLSLKLYHFACIFEIIESNRLVFILQLITLTLL